MLWLILSVIVVATSPVGKALADRLSGRRPASHDGDRELHFMEVRLEERIHELHDRIDAAERFLREAENGS